MRITTIVGDVTGAFLLLSLQFQPPLSMVRRLLGDKSGENQNSVMHFINSNIKLNYLYYVISESFEKRPENNPIAVK